VNDLAVPAKLAGFAVILIVAFGAAFGIGRAVGPVGDAAPAPAGITTTTTTMSGHGAHS
jgi:hypothetical protein